MEFKTILFGTKKIKVSANGFINYGKGWKNSSMEKNHRGFIYIDLPFDKDGNVTLHHKKHFIHRLVAMAFIDNPDPSNKIVIHIDGNKENNHKDNLKWGHRSESSFKKVVYKYKIGGEYTGEFFDSSYKASMSLSCKLTGGVSSCCTGIRSQWKGYEWSHMTPDEYILGRSGQMDKVERYKVKKEPVRSAQKVYKYHIGGEYTGECFDNTFKACTSFNDGKYAGSISSCFKGRLSSWKGFEWSYEEPELYSKNREKRLADFEKYKMTQKKSQKKQKNKVFKVKNLVKKPFFA